MTIAVETITIRRDALTPAAERLAGRIGDASEAAIEAALWRWLEQATDLLVADADTFATRSHSGLATARFDDALAEVLR